MLQELRRGWRGAWAAVVTAPLAALLAAGSLGGGALAQEMATPTASMAAGIPTVSVSGHGEVNVPPDTASVNIGVDIIKPTLDEAQTTAVGSAS